MAFFDEISKRMNTVAQGAQKAAEIVRIQRQIALKQGEYNKLIAEVGKAYYSAYRSETSAEGELSALCARLDSLQAEIDGLNLKLDDIKQIRRCTECGCVQNETNRFCSACGSKLPERVIPAEEPETVMQDAPAQPEEPVAAEEDFGKSVQILWPEAEENTAEENGTVVTEE